jgi:hypothetical protein
MKPYALTLVLVGAAAAGCSERAPLAPDAAPATATNAVLPAAAPIRNTNVVHIPLFIVDGNGQPPSAANTPLFEVRKRNPILAPDGHQVTLGEFNAVEGQASVQCVMRGTQVTLQLSHLIPRGVYTIWNLVFKAPGFEPTFTNLIGLGALGSSAGTQNEFRASASGEGAVSAITEAGPLSVFGAIGGCAPTDQFEWHVVGAYHIDGQSHGPVPGPDGTAVEQFGFIFKR